MNKKFAIMTWHTYNNYGSILQAYATRKIILQNFENSTVDLIDYLPKTQNNIKFIKKLTPKHIKRYMLNNSSKVKEARNQINIKFDEFRKNFTYTSKCNNANDLFKLNDEYDKFICGSDQIWTPIAFDEQYFLNFVNDANKKIAYAPSIGLDRIENINIREKMSKLINDFKYLSIREEKGKELIKEICNKEAYIVLDPTLLLTKEYWKQELNLKKYKEKDYILLYLLGDNINYYKIAKKISDALGKKLVIIPGNIISYTRDEGIIYNASPVEFLELINNAYGVVTDSFHGTIFSINFNIPFITFKRFKDNATSQNSRIYNILKKFNLQNRLYENNFQYLINNFNIDYEDTNGILEKERKKSFKFFIDALKEENTPIKDTIITNLCVGCGMCVSMCPKKCINIKLNEEGFYSYEIDKNECIKCGLCKKVCGQLGEDGKEVKELELYSAYSSDNEIISTSSSGGLAYEISRYALENCIPVIGCTYDSDKKIAKHIIVNKLEDLKRLSGSKYIQSYSVEAFSELLKLNKGLVIGTPCQIASIIDILKIVKKRDDFILVDLICHGVPTYHLWNKFLSKYEKIKYLNFREKKYGWKRKDMVLNNIHLKENKNLFYDFFELSIVNNKACYECKYRKTTLADIRIGDYWGETFKNNNTGVSMAILNSKKSKELFNKLTLEKRIVTTKQNVYDYYTSQQVYNIPASLNRERIIKELANGKIKLKTISRKYCLKIKKEKEFKRALYPIYLKLKGILTNGKK